MKTLQTTKARFYKVRSFADPEITYNVRQMPDGAWLCDCPNFVFNGYVEKPCKHILRLWGDLMGMPTKNELINEPLTEADL